ncbi:MAG: ribonuclease P protein component [Tahibacter sp.]
MEAQRFPRAARLLNAADFSALRSGSRRVASRHFHAEYRVNELNTARLGLAVSRRVSKKAVERNRIKRLARTSFRLQRITMPTLDILVIARQSAVPATGPELLNDLAMLWTKIAALKPPSLGVTMRA